MTMIDPSFMPEPQQPPHSAEASGLDMIRLLRRVLRGLPIMLLTCVLGTAGGYLLMKKLPPKYSSSVSILIDPKQPGSVGADTEFGSSLVDNSKISSVEIVLRSSNLLRQVVNTLHLADNPYYGGLQPTRLNALMQWITGRRPAPISDTQQDRENRAVGRLWQAVHPARIGATYVIELDVTAPNPKEASNIAGAVADAYIDGLYNSKLDAVRRDAAWLTDRLRSQREELIRSENEVTSVQQKFGLVGNDARDDAAVDRQSVGGVNQELIGAEGEVAGIESRYQAAVALQQRGGDIRSLPDVASSPVIQDLQKAKAQANQRAATLSSHYSRDFPAVKQAAKEAEAIDGMINAEAQRIIAGLKTQYATAVAHKGALATQMNRLVGKVTATANAQGQEQLRQAQRVTEANRVAYEASLTKLREVQEQESRVDVEARVISAPDFSDSPSFPRAIQVLPAGAVLGFLFGLGIIFVLPFGRPKFESATEVERGLSLHVFGTVPFLSANKLTRDGKPISIPDYLSLAPFSVFAESIRMLRYRMHAQKRASGRVLQVTSSVPSEGKSTIAQSLAISAATGRIRTVLIDLDLYRPSAGRLPGRGSEPGISDFLTGIAKSENAVTPDKNLPMSIIGAGSLHTLRPGIIESQKLADLIAKLRREYELIIIDTPPILAVADTLLISRLVDSILLVVAWRDTPSQVVEKAVSLMRSAGAPLDGVLLNKIKQDDKLTYGADDYGYYGNREAPVLTVS